jgi:hypothetical protein
MTNSRNLGRTRNALVLALGLVALILAIVPGVAVAADPPDFDVPPTPPLGTTLNVIVG